jgi:hypothetical protein
MRKIPLFFIALAVSSLTAPVCYAQMPDQAPAAENAPAPSVIPVGTPGALWLSVEDNMRNLTDAMKGEDMSEVPAFVSAMVQAADALRASNIQEQVKPQEEEHLLKSLEELKLAIDHLVDVTAATQDKAEIEKAVAQLSGAVTLTRIDVPPGLLEKISGSAVRAEIINTPVLQKDKPETVTLRLKSAISGKSLKSEDLEVTHTKIVHVLLVDPQLMDYTHAHPEEIDVPGEYTFMITPKTDCTYRLWADVTPVKGQQEFVMADIPGKDGCGSLPIDKTDSASVTVDGFTVDLTVPEGGLMVGVESTLELSIKNAAGEAVTTLEPLMGAYAHFVGFYDDYRTLAHMHPMGVEPKTDEDRGAAPLSFRFKPARGGFVKLFLQIRVDGKEVVFPLAVTVQE